jgi:uncharacterized protein YutD
MDDNKVAVTVNQLTYELIAEHREAWNEEAFIKRYSDILTKYDFIVGDWGYEQLRLRGFYEDNNRKAPFDSRIETLPEYILEYCNFGCAYFVVKKVKANATPIDKYTP